MQNYLTILATATLFFSGSAHASRTRYVRDVSNPEDILRLPGTRWVVVSCMRSANSAGALKIIDIQRPARAMAIQWKVGRRPVAISAASFAPHGLDVRRVGKDRFQMLVVDHGAGESIDQLLIDTSGTRPAIVETKRIFLPSHAWANGVAWLPGGGFVTTSMYDPKDTDMMRKMAQAKPTGRVWRWSLRQGWRPFGSVALSGANGIAVAPDGRAIYVSEWAARRIWKFDADGRPLKNATVSFLPDNLHWDRGRLLLAGQAALPQAVLGCAPAQCPKGFIVASVDPSSLHAEPIWNDAHSSSAEFAGGTGAIGVGNDVWVGSFMGSTVARRTP